MAEQRDWDKEMAAIDKVIAKGGYVAPSSGAPAPQGGGGGAPAPMASAGGVPAGSRAWFGMWARTLLTAALAFALWAWPWNRMCGFRLYWFLSATTVLALASIWVMTVSWKRRSAVSHILGLLMLGFALWLGAGEILPRVGYAKVHRVWGCPVEAPATNAVTQ